MQIELDIPLIVIVRRNVLRWREWGSVRNPACLWRRRRRWGLRESCTRENEKGSENNKYF
jgi:hypothetical protein